MELESLKFTYYLAKRYVTHPLRELRMALHNGADSYYTLLGDDVIERLDDGFKNPDKPLWLNLGYWKNARSYPDACQELARILGDRANLSPEDTVLDVGFGYADQDMFWAREFGPKHIYGINITPLHVEVASRRVVESELQDRITLKQGSATDIPFEDNSFDKVVALESAFHFNTREEFFKEAYRVLRPGGRLALLDFATLSENHKNGLVQRLWRKRSGISDHNFYNLDAFKEKLKKKGFINIEGESIAPFVFPGLVKYVEARYKGEPMSSVIVDLKESDFDAKKWSEPWRAWVGFEDYIVVHADKPLPKALN